MRGGALRILGYLASVLMALGSGVLLYRHLGIHGTARYTAAGSLIAIVSTATDLGLSAIAIRELSIRRGPDRERIAGVILGLRLTATIAGVIAVVIFAALAYDVDLGIGVALAGLGLVFVVWQNMLSVPLMVDLRLGWVAALELFSQLVMSLWIVAFVLLGAGLLWFLAASIPASIIALFVTVILLRGRIHIRFVLAPRQWLALMAPAVTYSIAVAAAALYFRVAVILVTLITHGHEPGYFSISFNVTASLFLIPGLLASAAFPIFSRAAQDDHERLAYALERVFEVMLIAGAWLALAIALGAHFAIVVLGGPKFAPASGILAIQGIAVGATFIGTVWGFGMLSLGRYSATMVFNLSALAMVVIAVSVLASVDGAHGAAIATSGVETLNAVVGYFMLTHGHSHLRPSLRVVPRIALATALAATPVLIPIPEPARVVLSLCIYLPALYLLRAVPSEVLDLVRHGPRSAT